MNFVSYLRIIEVSNIFIFTKFIILKNINFFYFIESI